ncbi:type II secretion system F family protein [Sutterella sp.]|uniref:type II secretion system F family protein n=1 Tax=Sutterella sp. TaxID=1981025 RepID=UPI0028438417|nr:type II secretion system F family protein [Sutterella sp.]MDR3966855.1 type II secretion system F family protein [Sutterella sp.]
MLNLFTILVFLFVLLGVLGLRAFTNRARREEMVRERLTELLTQVEEEAKSVAPVEYPDESVLMGLDDYHGHFPKLHARIVRICRAGVPAQTAFGLAAQNLRGALSEELRTIDRWLRLGVPLKQVLQESAHRVPLPEYRFFAVIVIISQESGGRLADTLERLAATLRERAELALKVQAKTSEARASIKIVACLVPGVLIYQYIQAPQDFQFLVTDPTGLKVLGYAAASVAAGLFVTWLMVRRIQ